MLGTAALAGAPLAATAGGAAYGPGVQALAITGFAPAYVFTDGTAYAPSAGALTLLGLQPTLSAASVVAVGAGVATLTGAEPTIGQAIQLEAGAAVLTGFGPDLQAWFAANVNDETWTAVPEAANIWTPA